MASGTWMAWTLHLKSSIYPIPHVGGMYAAVPALALNLALAAVLTPLLRGIPTRDTTDRNAYIG
jgi:SSS family solute:Na+ symporter